MSTNVSSTSINRYRRLKAWDYSRGASLFITVSTKLHRTLFGHIAGGVMHLSPIGRIVDAAIDCDRMLTASFSEGNPTGKLRHFPQAKEKDASGYSYCAVANLFGGNSGSVCDIFLEVKE